MTGSNNTRRTVLGLLAGAGVGGIAASAAGARQQTPVNSEMLSGAERLMGVSYTPSEREQMLNGIEAWMSRAERLRAVEKPNELAPALTFDPRLPGKTYRAQDNFVTGLPINAGPAPSDPADIAFAPSWKHAAWMASGELTSVQLTDIYLDRIARHGEALECFVTVTADLARRQAAQMDAERARGQVRGPLHGVPYALKDIIDVADIRATWGATLYQDRVAEETAVVAKRLEEAGAVLLGKATSGALAYGDIWFDGVTRNPFNPNEGSSGSSAGPASATAAALCSFAIGTETLGARIALVQEILERLGFDDLLEDGDLAFLREGDFLVRSLDALLQPGFLFGIGDVLELHAEGGAIGALENIEHLTDGRRLQPQIAVDEDLAIEIVGSETIGRRIQLGLLAEARQFQGIKIRRQVTAHAIGADQHDRGDGILDRLVDLFRRRAGALVLGDGVRQRHGRALDVAERGDQFAIGRARPVLAFPGRALGGLAGLGGGVPHLFKEGPPALRHGSRVGSVVRRHLLEIDGVAAKKERGVQESLVLGGAFVSHGAIQSASKGNTRRNGRVHMV